MRTSRRLATAGLSALAVGALLGATAGVGTAAAAPSAEASAFAGSARADALTIELFGQTLTTSAATADVKPGSATATATQVLTPLQQGVVSAEATAVGETKTSKPESCTGSELSAVPGIARLDITCGSATATLTDGGGSARGLGAEVVLEPSVSDALATLQLQQPARQGAGQLLDALNPLVEGLTGTPVGQLVDSTDTTVRDVIDKVLTLQATARIVIAPALAEVDATGDHVTAHARAQGIRIELLPVDGAGATNGLLPADLAAGEPLVTITIGNADVTKTVAKSGTAPATADSQGALVTIEFGTTTLARALGLPSDKIEVAAGRSFCIPGLDGTPLETCVTVADAGVDAQGNPFADGTSVQLFKGVDGGIDLATGRATTGGAAAATPAAAVVTAVPASGVPGDLPRTGGGATLALAGTFLLALAVATRRLASGRR